MFQACKELLSLLDVETYTAGLEVGAEYLVHHGRHPFIDLARERILCQHPEMVFDGVDLDLRTPPPAALATLRAVPAPLFGVVGMVDKAVARSDYRYSLAGGARPRNRRAFGH